MAEPSGPRENPAQDVQEVLAAAETGAANLSAAGRSFKECLGYSDWDALLEKCRREQYPAGSMIFGEGEPGDTLFVVLSGQLAVLKQKSDGGTALLAYRGAGEIVGEMGVIAHRPRSASVLAIQDTTLLRINGDDFRSLVGRVPGISRAVLDVLSDRLQEADDVRTSIVQQEQRLTRQVERLTDETERLAGLTQLRLESVDQIVHDMRNPLNVIDFCLEMLLVSLPRESKSAQEYLELAQQSSCKLSALIEALLEAARQEKDVWLVDLGSVDLADLLCSVVDGVRAKATSYEIGLALDSVPGIQVVGDSVQLERVLANLLDNALCYTPAGGEIRVNAETSGSSVRINVIDTGPGVPAEYREHIFERLARVPGAKGRRNGFGLGLYFCRQVVNAHGGRIWMEPGPGDVGSCFAFTLPVESGGSENED
jgi:signal transduction histidine kinase